MIQQSSGQKQKVRVYSDSLLCVGQRNESKEAIARREGQVEELKMYPSYKELVGIDGEAIELTDRIIFMSMLNDIDWS